MPGVARVCTRLDVPGSVEQRRLPFEGQNLVNQRDADGKLKFSRTIPRAEDRQAEAPAKGSPARGSQVNKGFPLVEELATASSHHEESLLASRRTCRQFHH